MSECRFPDLPIATAQLESQIYRCHYTDVRVSKKEQFGDHSFDFKLNYYNIRF